MLTLLIIAALIALLLLAALFANKEFIVHRELTIDKKPREIFEFIRYLKNHTSFSKWTTKDLDKMQPAIGIDGTKGFIQPWNNYKEKAGIGQLQINKIDDDEGLELIHRYIKPVRGLAVSKITIIPASDSSSVVKWAYCGKSRYPINLLTALLNMDKIVGRDLEICLVKLNKQLNAN